MLTFPKKICENSNRLRNAVQVQAKVTDEQKCLKRNFPVSYGPGSIW